MRDPVCAIDLFTISDAVLHAKTYSDVWEKPGMNGLNSIQFSV